MQVPCLTTVKLSFIFFYRRVFDQGSRKTFRIIVWTFAAIITVWGIAYFFVFLFICPGHPDAYWEALIDQKDDCLNVTSIHDSFSISDVILDILVITFPVPMVSLY